MANLAIKGHPTRGKEIIEILEMLGGKNLNNLDGASNMYYFMGLIVPKILAVGKLELDKSHEQFTYFTLEEFLEKFPYKVADKVFFGDINYIVWEIESMQWMSNEIKYIIKDNNKSRLCDIKAEHLQPYKEETVEEEEENFAECIEKTIQECLFGKEGDIKEIKIDIPEGYEFFGIDDNNKVVLTKIQSQYPKTYEECCECLSLGKDGKLYTKGYKASLIQNFQKLLICRDAYWKIVGEQMGLGKPWEPDWYSVRPHNFGIYRFENQIKYITLYVSNNLILVFPTEEMRDAFYENFKDLIEYCKELL